MIVQPHPQKAVVAVHNFTLFRNFDESILPFSIYQNSSGVS
jgi:hypothetical protein